MDVVASNDASQRELGELGELGVELGEWLSVGHMKLRVGVKYGNLHDSTHLLQTPNDNSSNSSSDSIRKRLDSDGYVLLRGVLDRDEVLAARHVVVCNLDKDWSVVDVDEARGRDVDMAFIKGRHGGVLLTGYTPITRHPDVLRLLEGQRLASLFRKHVFEGRTPSTFNNKWVRIKGKGEFTDEHTDFYRFSAGAEQMYTCWIPLGDYSPLDGTLVMCGGSHKLDGFTADEYNSESKMELPSSFTEFDRKPDTIWRSTNFRAGDVVIFDIKLIHAASVNTSDRFRISMDTRWQPAECVHEDNQSSFKSIEHAD